MQRVQRHAGQAAKAEEFLVYLGEAWDNLPASRNATQRGDRDVRGVLEVPETDIDATDASRTGEELLALYERMLVIREVESHLGRLFSDGRIPGFIHLSIGQEATSVGICAALNRDDTIASTHRGHGHSLAKGMAVLGLFHEILGHAEGVCRGRGGSLHVADYSVGMLGANGIVGAGIPIALGSALAHSLSRTDRVAVAFFGDGALAEGVLYESLNLAALWKLPLLFACENNGWSEFTPTSAEYAGDLVELAKSFGIAHWRVDGNDVQAVLAASRAAVARLRAGRGPAVLECMTMRTGGHYQGDPQKYRDRSQERAVIDPLAVARAALESLGTDSATIGGLEARIAAHIAAEAAAALRGTPASRAGPGDVVCP